MEEGKAFVNRGKSDTRHIPHLPQLTTPFLEKRRIEREWKKDDRYVPTGASTGAAATTYRNAKTNNNLTRSTSGTRQGNEERVSLLRGILNIIPI